MPVCVSRQLVKLVQLQESADYDYDDEEVVEGEEEDEAEDIILKNCIK